MQSCNINSFDTLLENFIFAWEIKDDTYNLLPIEYIIFNYKFPDEKGKWNLVKINAPVVKQRENKPAITKSKISGYSLPNTMDLTLWGTIIYTHEGTRARIDRPKSKATYEVIISEDKKVHNINITIADNYVL